MKPEVKLPPPDSKVLLYYWLFSTYLQGITKNMSSVLVDKTKESVWQSVVFAHQRGEYDVTCKPAIDLYTESCFCGGFAFACSADRVNSLITKIGHDKYFEQQILVVMDSYRSKRAFANSKEWTVTVLTLIKKTVLKQIEDIFSRNYFEIWNNCYIRRK